ncbi:helix-turn-helix domain-containing protein [Xanthomonas sp. AM6]|uniref:helix-turn-helix domain-containing protein n=1 Tax=Xanthomonas sp. AM6 TaxID=2982531 RepID=UPI0021DA583A|nr:helix-turn-helix domain-containing protein [Xanthomonas sp. AM6]UYB54278.1 helix-turn-helix domain-containing protein [Xanthomonas sp. AM6]
MSDAPRSSAEALDLHIPGRCMASSGGRAWEDLLVQIFEREPSQESLLVPAVPEPLVVWVLAGTATVEERELGGAWHANTVSVGDFFLTHAAEPYELRWAAEGRGPFAVMHLYLGLPLLQRAFQEVFPGAGELELRDVSGARDAVLCALLEPLRAELVSGHEPSGMFVQGLAQSLAVHLVRRYGGVAQTKRRPRGGLPAFKLRRAMALMEQELAQEFQLGRLARAADLSEFHFCRAFKQNTGYAPSRYFIRMRMERARRLLRETSRSIIEIGLEVGYSSASHFSQVFRRETGVTPSEYRGHA